MNKAGGIQESDVPVEPSDPAVDEPGPPTPE